MFKNYNKVEQGTIGVSAAIYHYQRIGYNVLIPINDIRSYDLVIEKDCIFYTVQVKTSSVKTKTGYLVQLKSVRSNKNTNIIRPLKQCCLVFILCDNNDMFSIPFDKLTSLNQINTGSYTQFLVNLKNPS